MKFFMLFVLITALAEGAFSQAFSGGAGTSDDPYQIATTADLIYLSQHHVNWDKHFIQTANIIFDANPDHVDWNGDGQPDGTGTSGFRPMGNAAVKFTGTYDGGNHIIRNLFINRTFTNYIGLFGSISGANIRNTGVVNASVNGGDNTGAVVGFQNNASNIYNCFSSGSINGLSYAGGIAGFSVGSNVTNCFSTASVNAGIYVGGLVGTISAGTLSNSYSAGRVSGTSVLGGLIGGNFNSGTVSNSYWDKQTSGQSSSVEGTGLTSLQMKMQSSFSGWDFSNIWDIQTDKYHSYPYLKAFAYDTPGEDPGINPIPGLAQLYSGGSGTTIDPYQISTVEDLVCLSQRSQDWSKHFLQTANIIFDANPDNVDWNGDGQPDGGGTSGFTPIGDSLVQFRGTYNGGYHIIRNLFINRTITNYIGLFGRIYLSEIRNLGLVNASVHGANYTGSIAGEINESTINNSFSTGIVTGSSNVGGLAGYIDYTSINNCFSDGRVTGTSSIGGLTGYVINTTLYNCYSTSIVSGGINAGGLNGSKRIPSHFNNSYWDINKSGLGRSAGGTGLTTPQMQLQSSFTGWDFNNTWVIQSGEYYSYPYLRNFMYDQPGASPEVNPIPGLLKVIYSGGYGTTEAPYRIATAADLIYLSQQSDDWNKHFIQTADISFDANPLLVDWDGDGQPDGNGTSGFTPVGNAAVQFTGSYKGGNHIIRNLFINRLSSDYTGLFGYISGAEIHNTGIVNALISGRNFTGALAGYLGNNSLIQSCYSTGFVTGNNRVGGLAGETFNSGSISSSYSLAQVNGASFVGGLLGFHAAGNVEQSYSAGQVNGNQYVGGLIGEFFLGTANNSYWDKQTSGKNNSAGGTGLTSFQMKNQSSFTGWNFENTWSIQSDEYISYPYLKSFVYNEPGAASEVNPIPGLFWTTVIWVGSGSNNWHEATNWSPAIVPDANFSVVITADNQPANYPVISNNASVKNLTINAPLENAITIEEGGTLTIYGRYTSGSGTAVKIKGSNNTQQ